MSRPDPVGKLFGNYRVEERLGSGGMGTVYRARHLHLDRDAAVKILHEHLAADPSIRARFQQEARAVSMLEHPNIVRLFDFGEQDGELYLVMELLTDGSLRTLLNERTTPGSGWSPEVGLDLIRQAADGLAYAHGLGIVHRDIKPDNLLLQSTRDAGRPFVGKLGDFGLARLGEGGGMTASGVTLGTPTYMSPEQCQGGQIDTRSDIYSLGVVLYEVMTGRPPFRMRTLSDAIYNHVYVAPPPPRLFRPSLSLEMEQVILRCLAKHPQDRYQSIQEFTAGLDAAIAALQAAPPSTPLTSDIPPPEPDTANVRTPIPTSSRVNLSVVQPPAVDPGGARVPRIVVFDAAGDVIETADLTGEGLTVGRLADNLLVVDDPRVSRHHLLIDWDGSRAQITDIGSSTGTVVGGTTIPANVPRDWKPDETVRIGNLQLRLVLPAVAPSPQRDNDPPAITDQSPRAPATEPTDGGRGRWVVAAVLAALVVAIGAGLLLTRGGDDDDPDIGAATSTSEVAATDGAPTEADPGSTASGDDPTATDPGSTASGDNPTAADPGATVALPTAPPMPETPEGWISVIAADALVGPLIGAPVGEATVVRAPFQEFERGIIIAVPEGIEGGGMLAAITSEEDYYAGTYTRYDTTDLATAVPEAPEATPPSGYYSPAGPFLSIWQSAPGLSDAIGWATYDEPGDRIVYQQFERGVVLYLEDTYRTWVFYGDLALDEGGPWKSFTNDVSVPEYAVTQGIPQIERVAALPEVASQLGEALGPAEPIWAPYQTYGDGLMFMTDFRATEDSSAAGQIISLVPDVSDELGTWHRSALPMDALDSDTSVLGDPPDGYYAPAFPFDIILANDADLAATIGWPDNPTVYSEAAWQRFERGIIVWFEYSYRSWVILGDSLSDESGSWISYSDE